MADKYADEISKGLRQQGCIVTSDPTSKWVEEPGRADLKVIKGGYGVCVEVKDGDELPTISHLYEQEYYHVMKKTKKGVLTQKEVKHAGTGFDLTNWRQNQREWSEIYCKNEPFSTDYWIALVIGVDAPSRDPNRVNEKTGIRWMPRRAWLFPFSIAKALDELILPIQNRLPYRVGKHMNTEMQEKHYDAVTLLAPYSLVWNKGCFITPENHLFYKNFLGLTPRPQAQEMELCVYTTEVNS